MAPKKRKAKQSEILKTSPMKRDKASKDETKEELEEKPGGEGVKNVTMECEGNNNNNGTWSDDESDSEPEIDWQSVINLARPCTSSSDSQYFQGNEDEEDVHEEVEETREDIAKLLAIGENIPESYFEGCSEDGASTSYEIPQEVQIVLDEGFKPERKIDPNDPEIAKIRRRNLNTRVNQIRAHKDHLQRLIRHCNVLNKAVNNEELMAMALSLMSSKRTYPPDPVNLKYFKEILKWFLKKIKVSDTKRTVDPELMANDHQSDPLVDILKVACQTLHISSDTQLTFLFIALIRGLGLSGRLVCNANVVNLRPLGHQLIPLGLGSCGGNNEKKKKLQMDFTSAKNWERDVLSPDRQNCVKIEKTPAPKKIKTPCYIQCDADYWAEVYVESESRWVCVNVPKGDIDDIKGITAKISRPLRYIFAYDNDLKIKDVTRRYDPYWVTRTQKLRIESVDAEWLSVILKPYAPAVTPRLTKENEDLENVTDDASFPKAIMDFKNHPYYVLKRHLLSNEAIYPADAPVLGFMLGNEIYSRYCVHKLYTREYWYKEAKVVKDGETAYKFTAKRKKKGKMPEGQTELFGAWQVKDYEPPTASDGIVPRNEYGRVDLFQPRMLPKGTVHLVKMPGLNKIADKLKIDCATAIVGFEFKRGQCIPLIDGYVVCEEYEEVLRDAWRESTKQ